MIFPDEVTLLASKCCSHLVTLANRFMLAPVAAMRVVDRKGVVASPSHPHKREGGMQHLPPESACSSRNPLHASQWWRVLYQSSWIPLDSTGIFKQIWQRKCQYSTGIQWNRISYRVTARFYLFIEGIYASGFHLNLEGSSIIQLNFSILYIVWYRV